MAYGTGQFQGLGRGWRAKVQYTVCDRCYGSGGGWGEVHKCDHCNGQGMVYELKPDAAKEQRIKDRAEHIDRSINLAVVEGVCNEQWTLRDRIFLLFARMTAGPQRMYARHPYEHVVPYDFKSRYSIVMDFVDISDAVSPQETQTDA